MDAKGELNRNDIVTSWSEAGYHIVINPAQEKTLLEDQWLQLKR